MRYLIYYNNEAFVTDWFEFQGMYVTGMVVFDFFSRTFYDGKEWKKIEHDSL